MARSRDSVSDGPGFSARSPIWTAFKAELPFSRISEDFPGGGPLLFAPDAVQVLDWLF